MLTPAGSYAALLNTFAWDIPARLNMATQVCDDWAAREPARTAIIDMTGPVRRDVSYAALRAMAESLATALADRGVTKGDRVGVLRSQDPWCAAAHVAIWKLGAVSVPLFKLFREEALKSRVGDSGLILSVADAEGAAMLSAIGSEALVPEDGLPDLMTPTLDTGVEEPAVLIYTSGTTGKPKGALHAHRVLTGHLPGVELSHDFLGQPGDVLWTPADWAWIGGLFDVLMPGLALGVPVVAARMAKFSVSECRDLIASTGIRNIFFPPTALRMLKADGAEIAGLRSVASGGEPLGAEMLAWGETALGVTINEFYGQTECNMVVSSCAAFTPGMGGAPYMVSKAAVEQLGRALRIELAAVGATAGLAYYGVVDTELARGTLDENPLGVRIGKLLPWPLNRRLSSDRAAELLVRSVCARRARLIAPAVWLPYFWLRGILDPVLAWKLTRDRTVAKIMRELEETAAQDRIPGR